MYLKLLRKSLVLISLFPVLLFAQTIQVRWDANTEDDLAGYKVYLGTAPRSYSNVWNVGNVTLFVIPETLAKGFTYYVAATAYDQSGNESNFSDEVSFDIEPDTVAPAPPTGLQVFIFDEPLVADADTIFTFNYDDYDVKTETRLEWGNNPVVSVVNGVLYRVKWNRDTIVNFFVNREINELSIIYSDGLSGNESVALYHNNALLGNFVANFNDDEVYKKTFHFSQPLTGLFELKVKTTGVSFRWNYVIVQ